MSTATTSVDWYLAEAQRFIEEVAPDNEALVPISHGQERREGGRLVWAAYLHIQSRRWGEIETSSAADSPARAVKQALTRLKGEIALAPR